MSTAARTSLRRATVEFEVVAGRLVGTIAIDDDPPRAFAGLAELERAIAGTGSRPPLVLVRSPEGEPPEAGLDALSDRELEMVAAAAAGASNREIAATMYYSVKSVEAYLTRIYRKLNIAGRRELTELWRAREQGEAVADLEVPEELARDLVGGRTEPGEAAPARARVTLTLIAGGRED